MRKFNEWMTKREDLSDFTTTTDLGMTTKEDNELIMSQLEQLVDKFAGVIYTVPTEKKAMLVEKVIKDLRDRIHEEV